MSLSDDQKQQILEIFRNATPEDKPAFKIWKYNGNKITIDKAFDEFHYNNKKYDYDQFTALYTQSQPSGTQGGAGQAGDTSGTQRDAGQAGDTSENPFGTSSPEIEENKIAQMIKNGFNWGENILKAGFAKAEDAIEYGTDLYYAAELYNELAKNRDLSYAMAIKRGGPEFLVKMGIVDAVDKDAVKPYTNALSMAMAAKCVRCSKLS
jgi:hypothetical protein